MATVTKLSPIIMAFLIFFINYLSILSLVKLRLTVCFGFLFSIGNVSKCLSQSLVFASNKSSNFMSWCPKYFSANSSKPCPCNAVILNITRNRVKRIIKSFLAVKSKKNIVKSLRIFFPGSASLIT